MCVRYATVFSKKTPLISLPPGSDFTVRITGGDQWGRETEPLETGAPALWRGYAPGLRRPNTQSGGPSFYANANALVPQAAFRVCTDLVATGGKAAATVARPKRRF